VDANERVAIQSFVRSIAAPERRVVAKSFEDDLDLLVFDERSGIFAIEFFWKYGSPSSANDVSVKRKIRMLRRRYSELSHFPITPIVIANPSKNGFDRIAKLIKEQPDSAVDVELLKNLEALIGREMVLSFERRERFSDPSIKEREFARLTLDHAQEKLALGLEHEAVCLTGPPGSGKSLVLAARARFLAQLHPDWQIQVLCYNNALVLHLQYLIGDYVNVTVSTLTRFIRNPNSRLTDSTVDALLIDEWQDFDPAAGRAAIRSLRPGRGGLMLAGDSQQALYITEPNIDWVQNLKLEHVKLEKPYRSSKQILNAVQILDPDLKLDNIEQAPDGPNVCVVRGDRAEDCMDAVVWDIKSLIAHGYEPRDIAVLSVINVTMFKVLAPKLYAARIPFRYIKRLEGETWQDVSLHENVVKVSTVASAKGLEFSNVLLLGVDQLKNPDERGIDILERENRIRFNRTVLVGPSRAQNYLCIYYSKPNYIVERLAKARDLQGYEFDFYEWPLDYPAHSGEIEDSDG